MNTTKFLITALLLHSTATSLSQEKDKFSSYSKVTIFAQTSHDLVAMQNRGIDIEHYVGSLGDGISVVINKDALGLLRQTGVPFVVDVDDMNLFYAQRNRVDIHNDTQGQRTLDANGIRDFRYGSMGGYLTYAEMVLQLDSMRIRYPNLITAKESLGVTEQGRVIWGVEVSDNPGTPEANEAVVHFDALHHAREPQSMATIMYYMYWLLDNYGTNDEATYLVNNRRLCFVPIVNPDGYVYNQTIAPTGGGSWRKNRRNNGDGSYGVDLNRNYNYQWGYDNTGSSPTPSSDTYRGPTALSEPEARAVRNFTMRKLPSIAMSAHTVAGRYLNPYSFKDTVISYEYYAEFASDFSAQNNYLYGTVFQMLAYNSNGTTRDYLHHDLGCYSWTPEFGGSDFWPLQQEIIPVAQENLLACKYMSWIAGGFADFQSFHLTANGFASRGDTLRFSITVRNKGVSLGANNVVVSVQSLYPNATPVHSLASYTTIAPRQGALNVTPFSFVISETASILDEMKFVAVISQEGLVTSRDTFSIVVGHPRVLFADDGESGIINWTSGGNGVRWDSTYVMSYRGTHSIADSRYGNVANSTNNTLTLTNSVNLSGTSNPRLEFFGRWANQSSSDYVRIQISTNNGTSWTNLAGRHSTLIGGQPSYSGNKGSWAWESMNLNAFIGQQIKLRFNLVTNSSLRGDGFYFDELRVVDYRDSVLTSTVTIANEPSTFTLTSNYPNPFNPATHIAYALPEPAHVHLAVFDILGRKVEELLDREMPVGNHAVSWNANSAASGVYLVRYSAYSLSGTLRYSQTRKILLAK